ncbi:MAG: YceI family protein [Bacteroidota bacterium]
MLYNSGVSVLPAFVLALLCSLPLSAQDLMKSKASALSFFSDTPTYDIDAKTDKSSAVIKLSTRQIAVKIPVAAFKFENKLMEEHFNDDYLETVKYPLCTFEGTFDKAPDWTAANQSILANGTLTMHGVSRKVMLSGSIVNKEGRHLLTGNMPVKLEDYGIKVPQLVFSKIAEVVDVKAEFEF